MAHKVGLKGRLEGNLEELMFRVKQEQANQAVKKLRKQIKQQKEKK